jgi:dihydroorotate dehydrogenase
MSLAKLGFKLTRPLLHGLDAETAHGVTIAALKAGLGGISKSRPSGKLAISRFGLDFANPLGLAAGFDKNAEVPDAMLAQGFGFVEVGTLTPRAQAGNPRPRLFRLTEDGAVINRMGFNNDGHAAALLRLQKRGGRTGIVGVNLGANKDSTDRISDYVSGIKTFAGVASYFTVNVSSPNTPGLRNLQSSSELRELLPRLNEARDGLPRRVPMLLKIAPDLEIADLLSIADCCQNGAVDGVIISNTTISRPLLQSGTASEQGGLSGAPLFDLSTQKLAQFYLCTEGKIPLIGVGGISNAEQAWEKLCAGASLLQIYSALVFQGPALVDDILEGLSQKSFTSLDEVIGSRAASIAHQSPAGK